MKRLALPIVLASGLLAQIASAQVSSSTPVLGYYKFTAPAGTSLWTCGFVRKKEFQGAATSITPGAVYSVINQTGATFPAFTNSYVEILSGTSAGLVLDIVSNTATSITVAGNLTGIPGTSTYCVRKHNTIGTVFAAGGGLSAGADTVALIGETGTQVFSFNGATWEDADLNDATEVVIYPGQGFIIGAGAARTVTFGGNDVSYVKTGPTKVSLYPGIANLVGLVNPLVATAPADPLFATAQNPLGNYGFVQSLAAGADTIDLRLNNGSLTSVGIFQSNGGNLEDADLNDASAVPVRNGSALIIGVPADRVYTAPQLHP